MLSRFANYTPISRRNVGEKAMSVTHICNYNQAPVLNNNNYLLHDVCSFVPVVLFPILVTSLRSWPRPSCGGECVGPNCKQG